MSATIKLRTVLSLSAVIGAVAIGVPALAPADDGCPNGLVPRRANPYDPVCVTKQVAAEIARENANAANLRDPNGAYGPNTCKPGYVWREAFEGDAVCVVPERRQETWKQNAAANMGPTGGMPLATERAPIATLPTSPKGPEAAYQRVKGLGFRMALGVGQHTNDKELSFYAVTPSGFEWEVGWNPIVVDETTWEPTTYQGISIWGHTREGQTIVDKFTQFKTGATSLLRDEDVVPALAGAGIGDN